MRRVLLLLGLGVLLVPGAWARGDAIEAGMFGDYFHMSQADTNLLGVGARLGVRMFPHVKLEGEMAYDFEQGFGEKTSDTSGNLVIQNTNVRLLHGLIGPKLELGHGAVRPFLLAKGGFDKYFVTGCPVTFSCVASQISNLRAQNVNGVFYPGGGVEAHLGPLGLRLEAGDEMYFNHGTHHNFRMGFGPYIRF